MAEHKASGEQSGAAPPGAGWTPIPDPTALTNTLVEKARDDIRREIDFVRQILSQRLDAMDTATQLMQDWRETLPKRLDEALVAYRRVMEERFNVVNEHFKVIGEKFAGIATQFEERDVRSSTNAVATKTAVDAAFQAQRDMVAAQNTNIAQALARIEATSQKQIEQLVTLLQTTTSGTNDKVDDLKQRLTLIEGRTAGITAAGTTQTSAQQTAQGASNNMIAVVAIVVTIVTVVISTIIGFVLRH